jgi:hypothetical protein
VTKSAAVSHTFRNVPESLGVFVRFATEGVDRGRLYGAAEARGTQAARELLRYLTDLPTSAKCQTVEQFLIGYAPKPGTEHESIEKWHALVSEVFTLAMVDLPAGPIDSGEYGERLITVICQASDIASPRLAAWGVQPPA